MEWLIWLVMIVLVVVVWLHFRGSDDNNLGIKGKLVWTDHGRQTKPFFNRTFEVFGKPDLMYRTKDGILAVEFKSRKGRVFLSDIVQAKCASLAARGAGYKVTEILVKTAREERYITLLSSDTALFNEIQPRVAMARKAKRGDQVPSFPEKNKCFSCAHNSSCESAAIRRAS